MTACRSRCRSSPSTACRRAPRTATHQGTIVTQTNVFLVPSARAEFIVAAPPSTVKKAQLVTLTIDGGASSDVNPYRPFAEISTSTAPQSPAEAGAAGQRRHRQAALRRPRQRQGHRDAQPLFLRDTSSPVGSTRKRRARSSSPWTARRRRCSIPTTRPRSSRRRARSSSGRSRTRRQEMHAFHMHQIHFLVTAINGVPIPKEQQQLYDVFPVPYWSGHPSDPFTSITVKLDFRGPDVGDFVYHCHILDHEDGGMMAIIRVLPRNCQERLTRAYADDPERSAACLGGGAPVARSRARRHRRHLSAARGRQRHPAARRSHEQERRAARQLQLLHLGR